MEFSKSDQAEWSTLDPSECLIKILEFFGVEEPDFVLVVWRTTNGNIYWAPSKVILESPWSWEHMIGLLYRVLHAMTEKSHDGWV